jgi:hypothetical protein
MATTTNYSWSTPDNTAYVKDGASSIRTLGSSVDTTLFTALGGAYPGLRLVKKQAVGTGVSSIVVPAAFSATYDNYKVVYNDGTASAITNVSCVLGSTATGYSSMRLFNQPNNGTPQGNGLDNQSNWAYFGQAGTNFINIDADFWNPFASRYTLYKGTYILDNGSNTTLGHTQGFLTNTTSYTAFTLTFGGGATATGGNIYVYGYGKS